MNLSREIVWYTPVLSLPEQGDSLLLAELQNYDSVRLFVERARVVLPAFNLTESNKAAVVRLCRRLDGIPLALELAAAWVRLLRVEQIVTRLDDRFRLLVGGSRTAPLRHRTLRALIDWSYDLLLPAEQRLLRRLSVFAGRFPLEAAEAIGDDANEGNALELMSQLVNKSLVVVGRVSGQEAHYALHETIRQYGLEKLAREGDEKRMRDRHAEYYCRLAETAEPQLYRADQLAWINRLKGEYDNLRAALDWSLTNPAADVKPGLRLAAALSYFWEAQGHLIEGHHWLEIALGKIDSADSPLQAWLLLNAGNFMFEHCNMWGGKFEPASRCARTALALYSRLEDEKGIAWTLRLQANCLTYTGKDEELKKAIVTFENGMALAEENDDKVLMARICQNLGRARILSGDSADAARLGEKGLAIAREIGDLYAIGYLSYQVGLAVARQADYSKAFESFSDALVVCRALSMDVNAMKTLLALGEMARLQKKYDVAVRNYQEYLMLADVVTGWGGHSTALSNLGHLAIRRGELQRATDYFRESMDRDINRYNVVWNLWGFGIVAAARGRNSQSARLYGVVDQLLKTEREEMVYREDKEEYMRDMARVRAQMSEAAFAVAWAEGRAMLLEEAITYALQDQA